MVMAHIYGSSMATKNMQTLCSDQMRGIDRSFSEDIYYFFVFSNIQNSLS